MAFDAPIYLDHNASCPIDPEVARAMRPYLERVFGNPSSQHWASEGAKDAIEGARAHVAALIGAEPEEIVFTSGGSEASNAAIKGAIWASEEPEPHLISAVAEHPATLQACRFLERQGSKLTLLRVDEHGRVSPEQVREALCDSTALVTLMHANNEVGSLNPIGEISAALQPSRPLFHCDASQSVGKVPVEVNAMGVDLLTIAGHKLYAPKGVGALYIRAGVRLEPLIHGGGHELGRRAGTESALLAVGLGEAARLAKLRLDQRDRTQALRDRLEAGLIERFGPRVVINGHPQERLPNTSNVSFLGATGAQVLQALPGVAASTGSACHEGQTTISPVLSAMGVSAEVGRGAVRFSLGWSTTQAQIDRVLALLSQLSSSLAPADA